MSALSLRHVFGLKGDVKDNVHYVDETSVLYPAGYNIVVFNVEKKQQRFIPLTGGTVPSVAGAAIPPTPSTGNNGTSVAGSSAAAASLAATATAAAGETKDGAFIAGSGDISAICLSSPTIKHANGTTVHAKSRLLAVAERGASGRATVTVYDVMTGKRKGKGPFSSSEVVSREYVSMCFSPDGKSLLCQGGAPDYTLVNWAWDKGRPLQYAKVSNKSGAPIYQCSFCPNDATVVCVTGNGILRFLHLEQSEFKAIPFSMGKREPQNYLCHCWIDDRILVGTDTGEILVFEQAEFRGQLESSPREGKSIDSIAAFSKGFVCGCDEGILYVFERDEKEFYKQSKSFQVDGNYVRIKNIAISPSEDNVCCTLENNQAYVLGLSNTDLLKSEEMNFEPLALPFHHQQITGLDVCIRKPLVVTCGMDRTVRVWNYLTKNIEVMRLFTEQPHSVAFHPSGLHVLIGFTDNLRLANLLGEDIRPYKDFAIKGCRECRFSNGGAYFAAANGPVIQLFSTYTCDMLGSFNFHKGKVRSIHWTPDDSHIVTSAMDGSLFQWRLKTLDSVIGVKHKCSYTSAVGSSDGKIFAVGSDRKVRAIESSDVAIDTSAGSAVVTQLCLPQPHPPNKDRLLFGGTETGVVKCWQLPLLEGKCYDQQTHTGGITRMRVSPDDNFLFTVGEDGCLAVFSIEHRDTALQQRHASRSHEYLAWAEEILVTKSELEEKMNAIKELQAKVEALQHYNEMQVKLRDMTYKQKMNETTEKYASDLDTDKKKYGSLDSEKQNVEKSHAAKVELLTQQQKAKIEQLQEHHIAKMRLEKERFEDLERKMKKDHESWDERTENRIKFYDAQQEALKAEYKEKLARELERKATLESERSAAQLDYEQTWSLMEQDADGEIGDLKGNYDKKLTTERMTTLRLKDLNAILKRKFGALRDDINENLEELKQKKDKQEQLYQEIDTLEKDIRGHQKEIKEREATIHDKATRIFELRKKNQELEKFKFVLDYKITELKRQMKPRKEQMDQLDEQIAQMQAELKGYMKQSVHLNLQVRELNLKLDGMEKEIVMRQSDREEVEARLRTFKTELHEVFLTVEDPKVLKDRVKRLYQRHVTSELTTVKTGAEDMHKDYQRQRAYLERSVDGLNAKLKKDMRVHKKDNMRIMQENTALITEINQLRREIKTMRDSQKMKDRAKAAARNGGAGGGRATRTELTPDALARRQALEMESEKQQEQIRALQAHLAALHRELGITGEEEKRQARPFSRGERLPPLGESKEEQTPRRAAEAAAQAALTGTGSIDAAILATTLVAANNNHDNNSAAAASPTSASVASVLSPSPPAANRQRPSSGGRTAIVNATATSATITATATPTTSTMNASSSSSSSSSKSSTLPLATRSTRGVGTGTGTGRTTTTTRAGAAPAPTPSIGGWTRGGSGTRPTR